MIKIAISGKANTGKDTVARLLIRNFADVGYHDSYIQQLAFADPIKEIVKIIFPQSDTRCLYGSSKYRNELISGTNLTYRQPLLDIGSFLKMYGDDIWINILDYKIKELEGLNKKIVIVTDARYEKEIDYLKRNHFYMIRTNRNVKNNIDHESESSQNKISDLLFDVLLNNNGTLDQLSTDIKAIISGILLKCHK